MNNTAKTLIIIGTVFILGGLIVQFAPKGFIPGKLPGDIRIEKEGFGFYFPVTTSILLSVLLPLVFWLHNKFK